MTADAVIELEGAQRSYRYSRFVCNQGPSIAISIGEDRWHAVT